MFILNANAGKLVSQTHDWKDGLVARKRKVRDFEGTFWSAPFFIASVIAAYFTYTNGATVGDLIGVGFVVFATGVVALYNLASGLGRPQMLVELEARERSIQWQYNVLLPYLERKYGVTFNKGTDVTEQMTAWVRKDDEQFKVLIENVEVVPNYGDEGDPYSYGYVFDEYRSPSLQRIHHPKVASYESLQSVT